MVVAYLIEYRQPPSGVKKAPTPKWLPVGVATAPTDMTPGEVFTTVRLEYTQLGDYELRVRYFHPLPGPRQEGDTANVLIIEQDFQPPEDMNVSCPHCGDGEDCTYSSSCQYRATPCYRNAILQDRQTG